MRTLEITATRMYKIKVDDDHIIVKEYESDKELAEHLLSYEFGAGLPVVASGGVKLVDWDIYDIEIEEKP